MSCGEFHRAPYQPTGRLRTSCGLLHSMSRDLALTPFCVADRPMSLRILRGLDLSRYTGRVGIMIHANTSVEFQNLVREYPLENGICPFHRRRHEGRQCARVREIRARTITMCDSGVFTKKGAPLSYAALFEVYERSRVKYGIIIDHLRRCDATLASARAAMAEYSRLPNRTFELVGVAQGNNVQEYKRCYRELKAMGYRHIAVGGLLNRRKNTARYVYVKGGRLFQILEALRDEYPRDWMFALGCYHPRRHDDFERYGVFGSDYKGWIFNYKPQNDRGVAGARASRFRQVRRFLERHVYSDARSPVDFRGHSRGRRRAELGVVACSKRKIWDEEELVGGAIARRTYRGTLFRLASEFADKHTDRWVILSGLHGFLNPDSRVPGPYNNRLPAKLRHAQIVKLRQQVIQKGLHKFDRVTVFGGAAYHRAVIGAFSPFGVEVRSAFATDARIGSRLRQLKEGRTLATSLS